MAAVLFEELVGPEQPGHAQPPPVPEDDFPGPAAGKPEHQPHVLAVRRLPQQHQSGHAGFEDDAIAATSPLSLWERVG